MRAVRATYSMVWIMDMLILGACTVATTPLPTLAPTLTSTITSGRTTPTPLQVTPSATPRKVIITPVPPSAPLPTPRPHQFDDVDARMILSAIFPDLKLTPSDDVFVANGDPSWTVWVNARMEGLFTQGLAPELAVIIANEAPNLSADQARHSAPWGSFLAILQRRADKLQVAQRAFLFPTAISPLAFDVKIDRATDFDHDGQDELLIDTTTTRLGISTSAAFLYQWDDQQFDEIWSAAIGEDNTGALNQSEYYASASDTRLVDIDGDGIDETVVDGTRVDYARDAQGLADAEREIARRSERRVFRWNGSVFVLDSARVTPMPPLSTRIP